ncbi:MAG TPA: bifunctional phosphoribosylaminoimidazolecarboxamide formyltransferase/IMP cyclohydrolase [Candidatus Polarisedimenticolia bacterium]|nr:bifunctional phosphoribosylaminoimidazolecarboxamide formyltransferase/IMP cyclohydrolase [Candidatus Polarisedimenticolia bacterium]
MPPPAERRLALLSVHDKTGLIDLAHGLREHGFTLLSTGGTAAALREAGLPVVEVSQHTGFPEILDGRVKTLHPKIHAGLLARRDLPAHLGALEELHIEPIQLLAVNLYPFEATAAKPGASREEILEMIDIGGPSMIRSAAKNHRDVAVVVDPADYPRILAELREGGVSQETRTALAAKAFARTAEYDRAIGTYLAAGGDPGPFPATLQLSFHKVSGLRYGENPHQEAAFYREGDAPAGSIARAEPIQGKELSFNNLLDLDSAWRLVSEFDPPAAAIIKHNNPCGAAVAGSAAEAFARARDADPQSAFGGVVALNRPLDVETVLEIGALFLEAIVAPSVPEEARALLKKKAQLRVLAASASRLELGGLDLRRVSGGLLTQTWDRETASVAQGRVVTRRVPTAAELEDLEFAWKIAKHVKSNAIVYAAGGRTLGIGAGQMSRVDAARLGVQKSLTPLSGCVLASDAFFPFRDGIDAAAQAGVAAVVQPGGSLRDPEVIAAADEHGLAMIFTGERHFRH